MELFFLCTIIMAAVSFLSIALSQPPVNFSLNIEANETSNVFEAPTGESTDATNNVLEYKQMREMASLTPSY